LFCASAEAQNYNQVVVFGDSSVDSGNYKGLTGAGQNPGGGAPFNNLWNQGVTHGAGVPTTSPGLMSPQVLAAFFGLRADPSGLDQIHPVGTDFATSGAKNVDINTSKNGDFTAAVPTGTQMVNYLASTGGKANPNALYVISSGGNDVAFALGQSGGTDTAPPNYIKNVADALAASVANLQSHGARYIIVPDLPFLSSDNPKVNLARKTYSLELWSELHSLGVNFVPADYAALRQAITDNPTSFGFTAATILPSSPACIQPTDQMTGKKPGAWALLCSTDQGAPSQLVAPNADQTHLFADDQHLTTAGQKILADYEYSLLIAPSEISLLAESAVKARLGHVSNIQTQIDLSLEGRGPTGINAWVTGGVTSISMDNFHGFPDDRNQAVTITGGFDYALARGLIGGMAFSTGSLNSSLGTFGSFKQDETTASLYAAYKAGPLWGNVIGSYGHLDYDVNRITPIGITLQNNNGSTNGSNWSAAFEGGYKFWNGGLTHGPIAGFVYQNVNVGAFTETGSFTSLSFGSQSRQSSVGQLGYKVSYDWAEFQPFLQVSWDHEFADTNRNVVASLTTIVAPSYSLPAVVLGKDWGEVKGGVAVAMGSGVKFLATGTADLSQNRATVYGGQIGFNIAY
jgi:outer membrane lipase/esterase